MPTITVLANGAQFYVRDASAYRNDARFAVGDDQQQATGTTTGSGGVAIDPTVSQSQWLANYLLSAKDRSIAQFGADTSRMGTLGNLANTQYGNQTSRAGVVGNLYASLFGTPANYGAVSNLMRGQPNASGLSFWNALASGSHLGEGANTDPRGQLHNINPDQVISDLFGGVASYGQQGGGGGGGGSHHDQSGYERHRDALLGGQRHDDFQQQYGVSAEQLNKVAKIGDEGQRKAEFEKLKHGPAGYAAGGDIVVNHPATLHLADGRVIPIGEYGRPEQLTVTPLATNPLPPRYYAGLMPGSQQNGAGMAAGDTLSMPAAPDPLTAGDTADPTLAGDVGAGMVGQGTIDPTNPTPDPRTLAEITAVLHTPPALHPSAIEQAIRANWTLDARGHPQFTGAQQQPQATQAGLLPGMAMGGALTFGGGAPAVLYPNATVRTSASAPSDTGQVTSASTHAGQTSTGPYYTRSPWNDPRYAQTADIQNLSPLEKSLLESTTAAMGVPSSEWWSIYQRSRPSFQNAAVGAGFTRAA